MPMKPILIALAFIAISCTAHAQQPPPKTPKEPDYDIIPEPPRDTIPVNGVYKAVDHEPEFPGGYAAFNRFLAKKLKYPKTNIDAQGKVFVQFIVEKDGSLSNIHVIRGLAAELDAEAIRVMKLSPKWHPGSQNRKHVRVLYNLPISFLVQ
jgi:TonB family protein